jgi:hypothetical protein
MIALTHIHAAHGSHMPRDVHLKLCLATHAVHLRVGLPGSGVRRMTRAVIVPLYRSNVGVQQI